MKEVKYPSARSLPQNSRKVKRKVEEATFNEILDKIEFEFYYNRKNFYSINEVMNLLGLEKDKIIKMINLFMLDAIYIERVVRIPYNAIINWIFYHKEWKEQVCKQDLINYLTPREAVNLPIL